MNLVKELRKIAQLNAENALAQANSILDADGEKDMQMLQYFGRYSEVKKAESKKQIHQQIISGNFVTLSDIRKVCFKYALRYAKAEFYKKTIPAHALNDLRKFKECNKGIYSDKLKVIAPVSHFHTVDAPKKDPVLVYEHSENIIEVISTWGNDFSFTRRLVGIWAVYYMLIPAIILFTILVLGVIGCIAFPMENFIWFVSASCVTICIFIIPILFSHWIQESKESLSIWQNSSMFFQKKWNTNFK